MRFTKLFIPVLLTIVVPVGAFSQQTNPVERQVANPITDTPNINPISPEKNIAAPKLKKKPKQPLESERRKSLPLWLNRR